MLVFDLETNGLLNDVTCIHCLVIYDSETDQTLVFNDNGSEEPIVRGIQLLETAEIICGHNVISYDIPVIEKLYPWFTPTALVIDTLLLSRLYHADMMAIDKRKQWTRMPQQMYGRHSLESYGYRLGEYKGSSVRPLIGKSGHKKCRITAYKMSTLRQNYASISTLT